MFLFFKVGRTREDTLIPWHRYNVSYGSIKSAEYKQMTGGRRHIFSSFYSRAKKKNHESQIYQLMMPNTVELIYRHVCI